MGPDIDDHRSDRWRLLLYAVVVMMTFPVSLLFYDVHKMPRRCRDLSLVSVCVLVAVVVGLSALATVVMQMPHSLDGRHGDDAASTER